MKAIIYRIILRIRSGSKRWSIGGHWRLFRFIICLDYYPKMRFLVPIIICLFVMFHIEMFQWELIYWSLISTKFINAESYWTYNTIITLLPLSLTFKLEYPVYLYNSKHLFISQLTTEHSSLLIFVSLYDWFLSTRPFPMNFIHSFIIDDSKK